jgi:hypothetical protein
MFADARYNHIFQEPETIQLEIPFTQTPGPIDVPMVPWIIEAPLNSVEILEAILKPSHPFKIHTARHVRRTCTRDMDWDKGRFHNIFVLKKLHAEYIRLQGRLEVEDREISFVCIPAMHILTIRSRLWGVFTPVLLNYVSITWLTKAYEFPSLQHPRALVQHGQKPLPGSIYSYERRLHRLLKDLGLQNCQFQRSLLKLGTSPLPEHLWDWFAGRPGTTAALPYLAPAEVVDANREDIEGRA